MTAFRKPAFSFLGLCLAALSTLPGCGSAKDDPEPQAPISCTIAVDPAAMPALPSGLPTASFSGTPESASVFVHGVASGDPTVSAVIVWTRVTPPASSPATVSVFYEVALDEAFEQRVAAGEVTTDASRDYTVKVDATELKWGRNYFYRFQSFGQASPVGRTRLAPGAEGANCARFAVVSCSSLAHGYFFAYSHIANRPDIDAVLHLGDYIYEYGNSSYGGVRAYEPDHDIVTLDDYRTRYQQYRRDPDLQKIHQAHPMYNVWDDHESANNSYTDGAENHHDDQGDWQTRKEAAQRAYFEWLPIRDNVEYQVWRSFSYGELADLIFLDTRLAGRDIQVGQQGEDAPERHILGDDQEAWLENELATGKGHWQVIGQQVMVAQLMVSGGAINMDQWDGYTFARDRFFDMVEKHTDENLVVLTGDIHTSWVWQLARDPYAADWDPTQDFLGVEFVVPGISSPGLTQGFNDILGPKIKDENPHLKWNDLSQRGYMILDLTTERVQADWFLLDGVLAHEGNEYFASGWTAAHGNARLREMAAPVERAAR